MGRSAFPKTARRWLCAAALLSAVPWPAAAQGGIVGTWLTEDGESKVSISATDGGTTLGATLVWLKAGAAAGQPLLDRNNPDPALRSRPLLGITILSGFKSAGSGEWEGGAVYAPRSGKTHPAELALLPDGRLQLKVKAGLITRTEVWTR